MKSKSKIIILVTFGVLFFYLPIIISNLRFISSNTTKNLNFSYDMNLEEINLKISTVSGEIHIIGDSGWIDFKNAGNCSGEGTYIDPYVIQDLVMDARNMGYGILIENSNVYFRIENCTIYISSSLDTPPLGIHLSKVKNSQLINNNCSYMSYGIYLYDCINNTISGNFVNNNNYGGMFLSNSDYSTISGNTANNNIYGIILKSGENNNISGNYINNNWCGIFLEANHNNITENILNNNYWAGINIEIGNGITISRNTLNNCGLSLYGLDFEYFGFEIEGYSFDIENMISHNIDSTNLVNGKPLYYYTNAVNLKSNNFIDAGQVLLVNCNDSTISNLNIINCTKGITLYYCANISILGNTVNNNCYGISLFYSNYNDIIGNTANLNNENGIFLYVSENNNVSGNTMKDCGLEIFGSFEKLSSNDIDDTNLVNGRILYYYTNEVNLGPTDFTNGGQVILINCHDSLISNLNASYCTKGISLFYCTNNNISGNTANNNKIGIYLYRESDNNEIIGNIANNNQIGIHLYRDCDNNKILGNTASNNSHDGIYIYRSCSNNEITGNTANFNMVGIYVGFINSYNTISGNAANYNNVGIVISTSDYNTVSGNVASYNTRDGIHVYYSDYNDVTGNTINYNNEYGLFLGQSNYNLISGNTLVGNIECIVEYNCQGNKFYNNGSCTYCNAEDLIPIYNHFFLVGIISVILIVLIFLVKRVRKF